jgi:hypothetical protein
MSLFCCRSSPLSLSSYIHFSLFICPILCTDVRIKAMNHQDKDASRVIPFTTSRLLMWFNPVSSGMFYQPVLCKSEEKRIFSFFFVCVCVCVSHLFLFRFSRSHTHTHCLSLLLFSLSLVLLGEGVLHAVHLMDHALHVHRDISSPVQVCVVSVMGENILPTLMHYPVARVPV